jgi:hypothetical protein
VTSGSGCASSAQIALTVKSDDAGAGGHAEVPLRADMKSAGLAFVAPELSIQLR